MVINLGKLLYERLSFVQFIFFYGHFTIRILFCNGFGKKESLKFDNSKRAGGRVQKKSNLKFSIKKNFFFLLLKICNENIG